MHTVAGVPTVAQSGNDIGSMQRPKSPNSGHEDRGHRYNKPLAKNTTSTTLQQREPVKLLQELAAINLFRSYLIETNDPEAGSAIG